MRAAKDPNILVEYRTSNGLTQKDIADRLHSTKNTVINWENGRTVPTKKYRRMLADMMGVSYDVVTRRFKATKAHSKSALCETGKIVIYKALGSQEIEGYLSSYLENAYSLVGYRVSGNKMAGSCLPDHSIAIVKKQFYIKDGEIAVIIINKTDAEIAHLYHDDTKLILRYSDGKTKDKIVDLTETTIEIIGKVIAFQGEFE